MRPDRRNFTKLFSDYPGFSLRHLLPRVQEIGILPSSYSDEIFEIAAKFIFDLNEQFDLIGISGDVATIGTNDSLTAAYDYVASPYGNDYLTTKSCPTLGGDASRLFLIPGNHDRYKNMLADTGSVLFDRIFKKFWNTKTGVTSRVLAKEGNHLGIVAGDFCLRSNDDASGFDRYGRGKAYDDVVAAMIQETSRIRRTYKLSDVIWMVHFPPTGTPAILELIDGYHLEGAAISSKIPYIIAGHLHSNTVFRTQYGTPLICAGSLCAYEDHGDNWIHFLDIEMNNGKVGILNRSDFSWSDDEDSFVHTNSIRIEEGDITRSTP
jgi:predicted phosphodiesterase